MKKILCNFFKLLNKKEKVNFLKILILTFLGAIAETLSVGALFPLITTISNPTNSKFSFILNFLGLNKANTENIILWGLIILLILYLIKSVYLSILTWLQMGFLYKNQASFSQNLFNKYLNNAYTFHINRNSSELIRNIVTETNVYLTYFLQAGLNFLTEIMVALLVITLLILVQPQSALFLFISFGFGLWVFNKFLGKKVSNWGNYRQTIEGERVKILQESFGSIKEILVFGRQNYFYSRFENTDNINAQLARKQSTLMQLPRIWLEIIAMCGISIMIIFLLQTGKSINEILGILVIYVAAAFRLLPSFSRIMGSIQSIKYSLPVLDMFKKDLVQLRNKIELNTNINDFIFNYKIHFNKINFKYSLSDNYIINQTDFEIKKGSIIGFVGNSAAGKSTLIDIFLGLLNPTSGVVMVDGIDISENLIGWQKLIGYVPQNIFLMDESLINNVAFGIPNEKIDKQKVIKALELSNLELLLGVNNEGLNIKIGEKGIKLSGGQRQRIGIARALYHNPEILVFDEATSALDSNTESEVLKTIYNMRGLKTILIITHKVHTLKNCDIVYLVENGKVKNLV